MNKLEDINAFTVGKMMLEAYGIDTDESERINESRIESDDDKLFGIDGAFVENLDNTITTLQDNPDFQEFIERVFKDISTTEDYTVYSLWSDGFIADKIGKILSEMLPGELFVYDNLLRSIIEEGDDIEMVAFEPYDKTRLPRITRIY